MKNLRFQPQYGFISVLLLITEILIAVFVKNSFLRGTVGDILVVILIYSFVQTFFRFDKKKTLIGVVVFAFLVEISQLFNLTKVLNVERFPIISLILGSTFDWMDLLAYLIGGGIVFWVEKYYERCFRRQLEL